MADVSLAKLLEISLEAGREILDVYEKDISVETKDDDSPLTEADQRAHQTIVSGLQEAYRDVPVLSEEGSDVAYADRKDWEAFLLVDPLDGTKEFIKKNGEFTVNIALIEGQYPALGVIYAPALDTFYFGRTGLGAFKLEGASQADVADERRLVEASVRLPLAEESDVVNVVASRSHMSAETEEFIEDLRGSNREVDVVSAGSSLKFCLVAEGKADYYPRYAPTMEWDTGAGQAIVEAAGGSVVRYEDNERFYYNRENLKNGWFLAKG
ncbi:3'(2'),5'-bisphosphate nucleotidase CysQ [Lentibacillus amyloliquefaciens]|uniref:3'(2'),5'-bisphosphate nucleotidase CysQ n=1 Tax=Lentibacillus amyloliquefaciens TaxID=1472767 RepID=A0A0U3WAX4_9BACI|nr:3'(2'),5'-bisphosphate nucleotidase CysQ [Lentibacillus amyloliquefaciens]ALX50114.1 3'(2'),5'-bisphosphate nucleotidase CysQ [Lentibacillus amyloliquefaciens]